MKILFVASLNSHAGKMAPFITEQADALIAAGCSVEYFGIVGKGVKGYLHSLKNLRAKIEEVKPDIIHAHYGLCGLVAGLAISPFSPFSHLANRPKLVTTYHGSDINNPKVLPLSRLAMLMSVWNVFISKKTMNIALGTNQSSISNHQSSIAHKSALIPCGINMPPEDGDPRITNALLTVSKVLEPGKKHVLFAGAFDNAVKDPELAKSVITIINERLMAQLTEINGELHNGTVPVCKNDILLVELKGYDRDQVTALMYKCDAFLMTSKSEGSPQVIKEAMACGLPIVSVDVGDVRERLTISPLSHLAASPLLEGCYIADSRNPEEIAELLVKALGKEKVKDNGDRFRTDGRQRIEEMGLKNEIVAQKLIALYQKSL